MTGSKGHVPYSKKYIQNHNRTLIHLTLWGSIQLVQIIKNRSKGLLVTLYDVSLKIGEHEIGSHNGEVTNIGTDNSGFIVLKIFLLCE